MNATITAVISNAAVIAGIIVTLAALVKLSVEKRKMQADVEVSKADSASKLVATGLSLLGPLQERITYLENALRQCQSRTIKLEYEERHGDGD